MESSLNSSIFNDLSRHLATERLGAYRSSGDANQTVLARYLLNMALAEALYPSLQFAEVALRNGIHTAMSAHLGCENWYDSPGAKLTPWQQDQLTSAKKNLQKENKKLSSGRVVAELNFGFWTGFFNNVHMRTGIAAMLAKSVFAHAPKQERNIKALDKRWGKVRFLRNRVFHHERIVHWKDLDQQHASLLLLVGWIDPQLRSCIDTLDRFSLVRKGGLNFWLEQASALLKAPPSVSPTSPQWSICDAMCQDEEQTAPFGRRWYSGITEISLAGLTALTQGKYLACDVRDEYIHYLRLKR